MLTCRKLVLYLTLGLLIKSIKSDNTEILEAYRNVVDKLKLADKYMKETIEAVNELGRIFETDTVEPSWNSKNNEHSSETSHASTAVPKGMEQIYAVIDAHNVWQRMKSWIRPDTSTTRKTALSSLALEISSINMDTNRNIFDFGGVESIMFKDTSRGCMVFSSTFDLDVKFAIIAANIHHNGSYIKMYSNTCGKGVCFIHESDGKHHQLILIQKTSMMASYSVELQYGVQISQTDTFTVRIYVTNNNQLPDKVHQITTIPEFRVKHSNQSAVTYDPADPIESITIHSEFTTDSGNLTNLKCRSRFWYDHNSKYSDVSDSVNNSVKLATSETYVSFFNTSTNDSTVLKYCSIYSSSAHDIKWTITIHNQYNIFPRIEGEPKRSHELHILGNTNRTYIVEQHSTLFANANILFSDISKINVSINKIVNGTRMGDFPGFDVMVTKYTDWAEILMTTYDILPEDSGTYVITASSNSNALSKNLTIRVFEETITFNGFSRKTNINYSTGKEIMDLTCTAAGRPRPKIDFYEQVVDDNYHIEYDKLENNDMFTIYSSNITDNMISRTIRILQFPANASVTHVFTVACKAYNEYQTEYNIHHVYKYNFGL